MRFLPSPKHQKLVNNCYPTGRTTDKKPKSSETAYLIYYVNSRRSKLEKVSNYLVKKSLIDLRKKQIGNISVTLILINEIIKNCKENLNVFVKDFMVIMNKILADYSFNNDLSVVDLTQECFKSICINVSDVFYSGDAAFVEIFKQFVDIYFKAAGDLLNNDELILKGCLNISLTSGLASSPKLKHLISQSVSMSLARLGQTYPQFDVINLDAEQDHHLTKRLSRTHTKMFSLGNCDEDRSLSLEVLKSYFNTNETDKLTLSITALLSHLQKTPNKDLLIFVFDGIPVQLRYILILFLVKQLSDKTKDIKQDITLKLLSALLTCYVGIVGLSILDLMRKLLTFQLANINNKIFVAQARVTIADLNAKSYYNEQTTDMLYELLSRLKNENNETNKEIVISDLRQIIDEAVQPCIDLDVFLNLVSHIKLDYLKLFKLVDQQIPQSQVFINLFKFIDNLEDVNVQTTLMNLVFENYKNFALLSGLDYYIQLDIKPCPAYYLYHECAAKFLKLTDYETQIKYKKESNILFTRDDLINFYSDVGSNKYSKRGIQILMSQGSFSSADLLSQNNISNTKSEISNTSMASDFDQTTMQVPLSPLLVNHHSLKVKNFSSDSKSLTGSKSKTPKISDLKKAFLKTNGKSNVDRSNTVLGTESLKSRVTNITFLLSELKSSTNETNKIQDPDEEETIGMDKIDMARSTSLKMMPTSNFRNSFQIPNNKRETIIQEPVLEDDEFKDAPEEFGVEDSRGKLFTL